ncbi:STAS domain-containing protein [Streptomyces roseolus]|uniref:STAS domain-containing protein n=1 Tax=Streptomyces roseolus TaxID=67358 RepID=UPI001671CBF9|nr:STAS domain-containing protein [Streptomyces roseolus]GGR40118.1 anti-sigma factor antagonist [Streptomyces roseolus]
MTTIEADQDDRGGWTVLRLRGELDLLTSPQIRRRVHDAVAAGRHHLVVDLTGVRFCDSSGIGVLVATRRLLRSCGGRLRLVLPRAGEGHGHVTRVFAALGVTRLFEVYEDLPAALAGGPAAVPPQAGPTLLPPGPPLASVSPPPPVTPLPRTAP